MCVRVCACVFGWQVSSILSEIEVCVCARSSFQQNLHHVDFGTGLCSRLGCSQGETNTTIGAIKDSVVLAEERIAEDPEFSTEKRVESLDPELALDRIGRRLSLEDIPARVLIHVLVE